MSHSIFVCYRRRSDAEAAQVIADHMAREHPSWDVFKDNLSVPPGATWPEHIRKELEGADTVLVVIGKDWLGAFNPGGTQDADAFDWVRHEISTALRLKKRVIPILVDAEMPRKACLPEEMKGLCDCQGIGVRSSVSGMKADLRQLGRVFSNRTSARFALAAGLVLLVWQLAGIIGVQTKKAVALLGLMPAYPSEVIIYSLCALPFFLLPLHWIVHRHFRALPRSWFPDAGLFGRPDRAAFGIAAFFLLLIGPTAVQCFWVGRAFDNDHLYMVWKGGRETRYMGWSLLNDVKRPDGTAASPLDSNWAWQYWYDEKTIIMEKGWDEKNLTAHEADFAKTSVSPSAVPVLMPWWFLIQGIVLLVSTLALLWHVIWVHLLKTKAAGRRVRQPGKTAGAGQVPSAL